MASLSPSRPRRATSFDIAELAGVSQSTVSRALSGSPSVSESTRLKVANAAQLLNYRVDIAARNLRAQCTRTIALLLRDDTDTFARPINPFFLDLIGNITMVAARRGYDTLLSFQQFSNDWRADYTERGRADGIIFLGYGDFLAYAQRIDRLDEAGSAYITWGPQVAGHTGHFVGCDNEAGGAAATRHLLGLGRRRIAYLGENTPNWPEMRSRWLGYVAAHQERGLVPEAALHVLPDGGDTNEGQGLAALLDRGTPIDAIFVSTDLMAIAAMRTLKARGLRVPQDVAVVGFDDIYAAPLVDPPLTTVRQDVALAAQHLVDGLLRLIDGEEIASTLLPPTLIVRGSCGGAAG